MTKPSLILFCSDPLYRRHADFTYAHEHEAVVSLGIDRSLIDLEALIARSVNEAVDRVPTAATPTIALYRGWMLTIQQYESLYTELAGKGIDLINTPAAYQHCHHFPDSYTFISGSTPKSFTLDAAGGLSRERITAALETFADGPIIVKDYVKSRKHDWDTACFIPSAADTDAALRVVERFIELQGSDLTGGLVFREFLELESMGKHPFSSLPMTREYRIFYFDHSPICVVPYWEEAAYDELTRPPMERFNDIARTIQSRFFTMDVARRTNGDWAIIELGDGQVAGLPESVDRVAFYRALTA